MRQLKRGTVFSLPDAVALVSDCKFLILLIMMRVLDICEVDGSVSLRTLLCADEMVFVTIDTRTGLVNLRDTGDLAAAGRAPKYMSITDRLNENPAFLLEALVRLRMNVRASHNCHLDLNAKILLVDYCGSGGAEGELPGTADVQNAKPFGPRLVFTA